MTRPTIAILVPMWLSLASLAFTSEPVQPVDYSRQIRPILAGRCFHCHGPDEATREAGLRLDEASTATSELRSGTRAIIPGDPDSSEIIARMIAVDDASRMPPPDTGKALSANEIQVLRQWIAEGANYTRHWAYVAPKRPEYPPVSNLAWPKNGIDYFILARLDREGLSPTEEADRATLLRRVALDLTGLPPTVDELDRFLQDSSPDAYEHAVDMQLAKQAYGERFASMWLDLARYGDSQGYIHDPPRTIWRWRDWLIEALNANVPYDQFTVEMLAGDLLPEPSFAQQIATGFHRNTTNNTEGGANPEEYRHASVVDRINTTMQVWMGITFGCAQCHTHKYDPISQHEYYQVFAIFNGTRDNNSEEPTLEVPRVGQREPFTKLTSELKKARGELYAETKRLDEGLSQWLETVARDSLPEEVAEIAALSTDDRKMEQHEKLAAYHRSLSESWNKLDQTAEQLKSQLDQVATTTLVMSEGPPRETHVAVRGNYRNHGDAVKPGVPSAFHPFPEQWTCDRLTFAKWLVAPENPLAARVAVNRLWQEVFGTGIVQTAEDFGNQGEQPSHPELLDWLASEYLRLEWDTKALLKLIVTSATYRQSSKTTSDLAARDPYNRLLARGPRVRLPAEAVRDQALSAAGLLSSKMHGPPVHPPQPVNGLAAAFGSSTDWETSAGEDRYRRAIYTSWRRNLPYASMITFDAPERTVCSSRRIRSNTPLQALVTLNDPVFVEAAQALARRTIREGGTGPGDRVEYAFRRVLLRYPEEAEKARLIALYEQARSKLAADPVAASVLATKPLGELPEGVDPVEAAAWTVVGNILLNLDETLSKP